MKLTDKWRRRLLLLFCALLLFGGGTLYGEYRAEQGMQIAVQVSGEAAAPGLIYLPPGSRVADALDICGITEFADLSRLNMAAYLSDGQALLIPRLPDAEAGSVLININTATAAQLESLPYIGSVRAAAIIAYREANGAFNSIADLLRVDGIGETVFAGIEGMICVE